MLLRFSPATAFARKQPSFQRKPGAASKLFFVVFYDFRADCAKVTLVHYIRDMTPSFLRFI